MKAYLDNGATTRTDPRVVEAMKPYFVEEYGNPASLHSYGQKAKEAVESARKYVAEFINAKKPKEIVFTSGGSEADNLAIQGVAKALKGKGNHIITSKIEHPAVMEACRALEKQGYKVTYLDVDQYGFIDLKQLEQSITDDTTLVSIMFANNEIGTIQPVKDIGEICRKHGVYFHTDAVQALGKVDIDVEDMNIDLLSASGHKLHGPKGVGFLYVREGVKVEPIIYGGGHEGGLRSGTANTTGIIGMAKAMELSKEPHQMETLRDRIITELTKIPNAKLNGHPTKRLSNNVNIAFKYIEGESILLHLDAAGIAVSTGSACSSLSLKPSHVLIAIGLAPEDSHGSVRVTLSKYTTEAEADHLIENLTKIVEKLRAISPLGKRGS